MTWTTKDTTTGETYVAMWLINDDQRRLRRLLNRYCLDTQGKPAPLVIFLQTSLFAFCRNHENYSQKKKPIKVSRTASKIKIYYLPILCSIVLDILSILWRRISIWGRFVKSVLLRDDPCTIDFSENEKSFVIMKLDTFYNPTLLYI